MRKISKFFAFLTAAAASAAMLTGCRSEHYLGLEGETGSVDLGPISYNGSTEAETFLTGLDGNKIKASEIKYLSNKKYKQTTVLDENDFTRAECVGFGYAFKPSVYFDEENAPEKFIDDGWTFIGQKPEASPEFFRVNVGDVFTMNNGSELTVKSARCVYNAYTRNGKWWQGYHGSEIELDGTVTLKGTLTIPSQMEQYPGLVLNMGFQGNLENSLPFSAEFAETDNGEFLHGVSKRCYLCTDVPEINLGKYTDYNIDFDGIAEGSHTPVEITITDINIRYGIQGYMGNPTAKLLSVKRLES